MIWSDTYKRTGKELDIMDADTFSAIFAGCSFLAAGYALWWQAKEQQHRYLLDQAILSLERAYEALIEGRPHDQQRPLPNRLNWLTCARHLQSYKAFKRQIKGSLHKSICEENEEHWRHQFYLCVNREVIHHPEYYAENGRDNKPGIDARSALIVHSFATWPKGKKDPIESVDLQNLLDDANPLNANIGLRFYIEHFAHLRYLTEPTAQRTDIIRSKE